jgi:S1-C subfamily serine protease
VDLYLQVDLSLPPGFSGGALVDTAGRALGVTSSWLLPRHSLAIPAVTVKRVVEALLAEGSIRRGFLGVGAFPIRFPEKLEQQIGQDGGLILVSLQPEGPAEKAGLLLGDILLSLDGASLTGIDDLVGLLDQKGIGKEVTLRILRAGQPEERTVAVGARA